MARSALFWRKPKNVSLFSRLHFDPNVLHFVLFRGYSSEASKNIQRFEIEVGGDRPTRP